MELEFGPFLRPKVSTTLTKRLLYWILLFARPVFFFFFSPASTFGVWPLTFPARAREPWTFPPFSGIVRSIVWFSNTARFTSSSSGAPEQKRFSCSQTHLPAWRVEPSDRLRRPLGTRPARASGFHSQSIASWRQNFSCRSESSNIS